MASRNIPFLCGQFYHIYNRGTNREDIFRCKENYEFLLRRINRYAPEFQVAIIVYCLMPNHYHFLLRQDSNKPISQFIQAVFNSYSKAFNNMFKRTGTLFEGPFKAIGIENYEYLLHLSRYIHRNPLDAGLVNHPADWKYSNYMDWVGNCPGGVTDMDFVREQFPDPAEYQKFVFDYLPPEKTVSVIRQLSLDWN